MLPFCAFEILGSICAQQGGQRVVRQTVQKQRAPAQGLRRDASAADRVPHVVLAVAKGSLSVLPGLPPVHRGKADKEGVGGEPLQERIEAFRRHLCPQLQRMLHGRVVIKTWGWRKARDFADEQIAFRGMQVAA